MDNQSYFYQFLESDSRELALLAKELENSLFTSPRMMLTHSRVFIETILEKVMEAEGIEELPRIGLKERLDLLDDRGYLTYEIRDALHNVRKLGNQASHDARMFRFSEALQSWEALYVIVKWFVEVYGPVDMNMPDYRDPSPRQERAFDMTELEIRLKGLEELLRNKPSDYGELESQKEVAAAAEVIEKVAEAPGFTTIRTLAYQGKTLDVPYFLRDAFLLPQRFDKSETFLIRLGAEQEARIMSELQTNLEGLHKKVKRYSAKNDEIFFDELRGFIEEEKIRRNLTVNRPGELFFFFKKDHLVVTEELAKVPLDSDEFKGIPSLLRQLNEDQIETVGELPKELVILAKYEHVGIGTVEKLFEQLKSKLNEKAVAMNAEESAEKERRSHKKWESLYVNVTHGDVKAVIRGESISSIWKAALGWMEDRRLPLHELVKEGITLGSTDAGQRYAIALEPIHKDNKHFAQLHTYKSVLSGEVYYLETKINPRSGLETLGKLLKRLGVEVDIPLLRE
ncbi:DUF4145 domain-containing protein [Neobacillus notoginsengisoli]|uniref:DUF4145 domain-containing protein n=1 Tax=Neobacillus notoginsengisoli TaxID=1578198 RepID=UPI001F00FFC9|nr:DUF4145 domain-containing protein [Neobacillus notoginsengisoli]